MKLVLVNYEYPPLGGGAANATAQLAFELAQLGHSTTVLTAGHGNDAGTDRTENGVRVIRLNARRGRIDRSDMGEMFSYACAAARALPQLLRSESADGVIVFFSMPCGPIGWYARWRTGVPYVISLRGGDVPGAEAGIGTIHRLLAPIRRAVMRGAVAVVANSNGLAKLSEHADPIPVSVIANGVDTEFFTPATDRAPRRDGATFLFAGRFQPQKNLFVLLEQFAQARIRTGVALHLILVGDGPQRADLETRARALGLADAIEWRGWLDKTGLLEAYRQADVFINPSLYEGMPNTVLEAMACGLPVIASRVSGNDELVVHAETGLLFDPAQPGNLESAMLDLARDPGRRTDMGNTARQTVCARYSWRTAAMQYVELLQRK